MSVRRPSLDEIRATRAIVDLDAIAENLRLLRNQLAPATSLMAVVKADAYGHGARRVARTALDAGCELLGVATVSEGLALREAGIGGRIVLLGSIGEWEAAAACRAGLEITVAGFELLDAVRRAARQHETGGPATVHLKIDTGLRRYGAAPNLASALAATITADPFLRLAAISTHFASADELEEPFTVVQGEIFAAAHAALREAEVQVPARHVANSAGILRKIGTEMEIARAGIAMYGIQPSAEIELLPGMRPVMRIESRIARVVPLDTGDTVGYNRTFRADRVMQGALIPIGYADGYRRSLSNRGWMGLHRRPASVIGRVSMDQTIIAVPADSRAAVGDVVHILGREEDGAPSAEDLAALMDTNAYEVLVGFRGRIPRLYRESNTAEIDQPAATVD